MEETEPADYNPNSTRSEKAASQGTPGTVEVCSEKMVDPLSTYNVCKNM